MTKKKETRPSLATSGRVCTKQNHLIKDSAFALAFIVSIYLFLTFGLGHFFGII